MLAHAAVLFLAATSVPDEALEALGREIEADFRHGRDGIAPRLDAKALFDTATNGLDVDAKFKEGMYKGFLGSVPTLTGALAKAAATGSVRFRRVTSVEGRPALQFRFLVNDGFDVVELVIDDKRKTGPAIVDWLQLAVGVPVTQTFRQVLIHGGVEKQGLVDRMLGTDRQGPERIEQMRTFGRLLREQKMAEALKVYQQLPEASKQERMVMVGLNNIHQALGDDGAYRAALGRFIERYPNDSAAMVHAIDYWLLKKDYDRSLAAVDAVEKRVGEDAWFSVLRGSVLVAGGDAKAAQAHFERAVELEPTLPKPYFALIELFLGQRQFGRVAHWLTRLEHDAGVQLNDLRTVPEYRAFVASKEGRRFVAQHATPAK